MDRAGLAPRMSDAIIWYLRLRNSGFNEEERFHVMGLADCSMSFENLRPYMVDPHPRARAAEASRAAAETIQRFRHSCRGRHACIAEQGDEYVNDEDGW